MSEGGRVNKKNKILLSLLRGLLLKVLLSSNFIAKRVQKNVFLVIFPDLSQEGSNRWDPL